MGYIKFSAFRRIQKILSNYWIVGYSEGSNFRISFKDFIEGFQLDINTGGGTPIGFDGLTLPSENNIGQPLRKGDWTLLEPDKQYTNIGGGQPINTPIGRWSIGIFNGSTWSLKDMGELPGMPLGVPGGAARFEIEKEILGDYTEETQDCSIYFQGNFFLKSDGTTINGDTWGNLKIPVLVGDVINFNGYSFVSSTPDALSFTMLEQSGDVLDGVVPIVVDSSTRSISYRSSVDGFIHVNLKVKGTANQPLSYTCERIRRSFSNNGYALLRSELNKPNGVASFDVLNDFIENEGIVKYEGSDTDVTNSYDSIQVGKVVNSDGSFTDADLFTLKIYKVGKGDIITFNGNSGGSDTSPTNKFPVLVQFDKDSNFSGVIGYRDQPFTVVAETKGVATMDGYVYVNTRPQSGVTSTVSINKATVYAYVEKSSINAPGGVLGYDKYAIGDKKVYNSGRFVSGLLRPDALISSTAWVNTKQAVKAGDMVELESFVDNFNNPMGFITDAKGNLVEVIRASVFNDQVLQKEVRFIKEDGFVVANSKKTNANYKLTVYSAQGIDSTKVSSGLTDVYNGVVKFGSFTITPTRWTVTQGANSYTFKPLVYDLPTYAGFKIDKKNIKIGDRVRIKGTVTSPNGFKLYLAKYDKPLVQNQGINTIIVDTTSNSFNLDYSFVYAGEIYLVMKASDYSSQVNISFFDLSIVNESYNGNFIKTETDLDIKGGQVKTIRKGGQAKLNTSFFNDLVDVDYFKAYPTASQSNPFCQNPLDIDDFGEVISYADVNGDIFVGFKQHEWNDYQLVNIHNIFPDVFISQTDDSHHSMNVSFTKDGYIIVTGNMHVSTCRCAITVNPYDISTWRLIKYTENTVTYPAIIKNSQKQLMIFFREGMAGSGDFYYSYFNDVTREFENKRQVINGTNTAMTGTGATLSPYPNQIIIDDNDKIRILLGFRIDSLGANRNMGMYYLESADWGNTWTESDGVTPYTLPTYATTLERVINIPVGTGYVNQAGSCMGHDGNFYSAIWQDVVDGANTYTQVLVIKNVAGVWSSEIVTENTFKNVFLENGGMIYKANRPIMFSDSEATYVIQKSADDRKTAYAINVATKEKKVLFKFPSNQDYYFEFAMSQNHLRNNILCLVTPKENRRDCFEYFVVKKFLY